ncbi:MAG: hypothetical protein LBS53_01385 [Synergistaceae bacterium]|jgi:hypothetical protein|nr:hypothetical protein [Synergistaceae bacterium]
MNENKEETTQTVGKMRFVVVSQFQNNGSTVNEKVKRLLEREAQERNEIRTFDKLGQADYIK